MKDSLGRRTSRPATRLLPVALLALLCAPAGAHHSFAVHYDLADDARIHRTGVIRKFSPRAPHTFIVVEVAGENGEPATDWVLEAPNRALLVRAGWPFDRLVQGLNVEFTGFPARNAEPAARLQYLHLQGITLCAYYCEED